MHIIAKIFYLCTYVGVCMCMSAHAIVRACVQFCAYMIVSMGMHESMLANAPACMCMCARIQEGDRMSVCICVGVCICVSGGRCEYLCAFKCECMQNCVCIQHHPGQIRGIFYTQANPWYPHKRKMKDFQNYEYSIKHPSISLVSKCHQNQIKITILSIKLYTYNLQAMC